MGTYSQLRSITKTKPNLAQKSEEGTLIGQNKLTPKSDKRRSDDAIIRRHDHATMRRPDDPTTRSSDDTIMRSSERKLTRASFNYYEDQLKHLKQMEIEAVIRGESFSKSHILRLALDQYFENLEKGKK